MMYDELIREVAGNPQRSGSSYIANLLLQEEAQASCPATYLNVLVNGYEVRGFNDHELQAFREITAVAHGIIMARQQLQAAPAPPVPAAPVWTRCDCGHTVPEAHVMRASHGTACPDCYDRLSDKA